MDPHATLVEYLKAIAERDVGAMAKANNDLIHWLIGGGFAPDTSKAIHAIFNMGD